MTTAELIKSISAKTGIPENKVRKSVFDFSRDCQSVIFRKATGGFRIPNVGYVAINVYWLISTIESNLKNLERSLKNVDLLSKPGTYRNVFIARLDDTYACINLVLENNLIKNEDYIKGAGSKIEVERDLLKEYMDRLAVVLNSIAFEYERTKYPEIQKICLQRMYKQGILQSASIKDPKV